MFEDVLENQVGPSAIVDGIATTPVPRFLLITGAHQIAVIRCTRPSRKPSSHPDVPPPHFTHSKLIKVS